MQLDILPTDTFKQFKIRRGFFRLNGSSIVPGGVNFCIYSAGATSCELVLFKDRAPKPFAIIPYPENYTQSLTNSPNTLFLKFYCQLILQNWCCITKLHRYYKMVVCIITTFNGVLLS